MEVQVNLSFQKLGLAPTLLTNVRREGYVEPTPIQSKAIPHLLEGRDLLGLAQTGTGKTAAFALPILQRLAAGRRATGPRALVLAPTRELAAQVHDSFSTYGRGLNLKSAVIFGGVGQRDQVNALRSGIDILVATPGRLLDLHQQGFLRLNSVEVLVLDEADRMLDMGFIKPIKQIIGLLPGQRQNLLFSATMPTAIRQLSGSLLQSPIEVRVAPKQTTTPQVDQYVCFVPRAAKPILLVKVLAEPEAKRVIVFTRTKRGADRLAKKLSRADIEASVIHGDKSQNARLKALARFKEGQVRVMVATDVAARGIDVDQVSHVVNYELPNEPESYVHRIGRTGRGGATGIAISFCDPTEREYLDDIAKLTRKKLQVLPVPDAIAQYEPPEPPAPRATNRPRPGRAQSGRSRSMRP